MYEEIHVYGGIAERTGVRYDREAVRRRGGLCTSFRSLEQKARSRGDGYFYLPVQAWPADADKIDITKAWVVVQ
jgi:hypothetical protein